MVVLERRQLSCRRNAKLWTVGGRRLLTVTTVIHVSPGIVDERSAHRTARKEQDEFENIRTVSSPTRLLWSAASFNLRMNESGRCTARWNGMLTRRKSGDEL